MVAKKSQTIAMKSCVQIAEFSFSYSKIQKIKQLACFYPKTIVLFSKSKIIEQGVDNFSRFYC